MAAIDRLGRSVAEVTRTIAELGERGITLRALREGVDTATPTGRAVAAIMATLAELELELSRERRTASRESRRRRGLPPTKPPRNSGKKTELVDLLLSAKASSSCSRNFPKSTILRSSNDCLKISRNISNGTQFLVTNLLLGGQRFHPRLKSHLEWST